MKPKKLKKLSLNKDTVVNLSNDEMDKMRGGSFIYACDDTLAISCFCTNYTCTTCNCGGGTSGTEVFI